MYGVRRCGVIIFGTVECGICVWYVSVTLLNVVFVYSICVWYVRVKHLCVVYVCVT